MTSSQAAQTRVAPGQRSAAASPVRHGHNAAISDRRRDRAYRWATLLLARLLYPIALLATLGRGGRRQAGEWALGLRFPAERLAGLHPAARAAFVAARTTALWRDHQLIGLTSGWRDAGKQQRMFEEAVAKYGSVTEASRWVLPPAESAHVRGTAMDVRPFDGAAWLDRHGARYGLHRTLAHEWWHFEYLPDGRPSPIQPASPRPR